MRHGGGSLLQRDVRDVLGGVKVYTHSIVACIGLSSCPDVCLFGIQSMIARLMLILSGAARTE